MGVQWTKEQQEVIRLRDRNILVSAAAGSGKTAVLVERILSKITDKEHPVDIDRPVSYTHLDVYKRQPESLLEKVLEGFDMEINEKVPTEFYCNCSRERVEKALISIGRKELNEMIQEGKSIEMNCHFCNKNYEFTVEELKEILRKCK